MSVSIVASGSTVLVTPVALRPLPPARHHRAVRGLRHLGGRGGARVPAVGLALGTSAHP